MICPTRIYKKCMALNFCVNITDNTLKKCVNTEILHITFSLYRQSIYLSNLR